MNFLEEAKKLHRAGLNVLPIGNGKAPYSKWTRFQSDRQTEDDLNAFASTNPHGMAIICGKISGGVVCLDIDLKHDSKKTVHLELEETLKGWGHPDLVKRLVIEQTPSGGLHWLFKTENEYRSDKLARDAGCVEAMLETRAEGGYFVCAPSPGYIVEEKDGTRKEKPPYVLLQGSLESIPMISRDEATAIMTACWALDRNEPEPAEVPKQKMDGKEWAGKSTFDDFNDRTTAQDMESWLFENGWRRTRVRGENVHYCRPGKSGPETSATIHQTKKTFVCFSTSQEFIIRKGYSPTGLYAMIYHRGNFSDTAKRLYADGFGDRQTKPKPEKEYRPEPKPVNTSPLFIDMNSLDEEMEAAFVAGDDKGLDTEWKGLEYRVADHQLTVVTGYPSHGKSSVIASLAVHLAKVNGWRFGVCSVEDYPDNKLGKKLIRKFTRKPIYALGKPEYLSAWKWVKEHFHFVNADREDLSVSGILAEAEAIHKAKPFNGLILDPWSEIDGGKPEGMTETDFIKESLKKCRQFARRNKVAVWILAHPAKPFKDKQGNYPDVDLYDIAGSQHWRAKADNGLVVARDFATNITTITVQKIKFSDYGKIMSRVELKFDVPSETYTEQGFMDGVRDHKQAAANENELPW